MEIPNSLEVLSVLEKKIANVLELLKEEKNLNAQLIKEREELISRLESAENSLLQESQSIDQLNQERFLTKEVVDELIRNIDRLVEVKQEER
ncbi:hypothetical protein [Candidatus Babela massiliensis]|uniref:Septal ring assembly protein ZapB n=1 Tax=Candidatus Babela massiliensis TaxID=673862 RepID=V6DIA0_9BACT|nr:hypothetical protein [Candidatus Babela massiliensis]CDK30256.1 Septal ring assembly protein ZapB [Candidatus Babela massiliensis]